MNPAWSVVLFTTLCGTAQGLAVFTAAFDGDAALALPLALLLAGAGLVASFFHLGRPARAWRAVAMWRTSWLSREVIVLPAFMAALGAWWLFDAPFARAMALLLCALLWLCTAMIYACLRFVQEWAHPFTLVVFVLTGLSSGGLLACALGTRAAPWALACTVLAGVARVASLARNDALRPRSTLQSATGVRSLRLKQIAMGMTGGSFNTREFFHGVAPDRLRLVRTLAIALGFGLPGLLALAGVLGWSGLWLLAWIVQCAGLLADRWYFFAQARHPQNLYYQAAS